MADKTKKPVSRACADRVGIMQYVELDDYVVAFPRRSEETPSVEKCYRIHKESGDVTEFSVADARIFRWTECVGRGKYMYVLKQDLLQIARVDVETLEETVIDAIGSFPHHLNLTEDYLYYSTKTEHSMIIRVDLHTLKGAGMDAESGYFNLKEDAWWAEGHMFYGMHDDFDREVSTFYCIDMDTFQAQRLSETPFSLDRFWEKSELLKEAYTFKAGDLLCTIIEQSRHTDCYYECMDPQAPAAVERKPLAGPMTYTFFAGGKIYLADMENAMTLACLDPVTGEKRVLAERTRCFEKDKFGHITGDRPQVVGDWLYYRDADTKEIVCLETVRQPAKAVK